MSETIIIAIITALATSIPTIIASNQNHKALIKIKEQEYKNTIYLKHYQAFHSYYIQYIRSIFAYIYNRTTTNEEKYRECFIILRTYSDFIHISLLDEIDSLLASNEFDNALNAIENLGTSIKIFSTKDDEPPSI